MNNLTIRTVLEKAVYDTLPIGHSIVCVERRSYFVAPNIIHYVVIIVVFE